MNCFFVDTDMKYFLYCLILTACFSCNQNRSIVQESFIDSLIENYSPSIIALTNEKDLEFWKSRVDTMPESFVNLQKYSAALSMRFHIDGDVRDLKKADSIMEKIADQYREPGPLLTLAGYKMLQHRFKEAKNYIDTVVAMKAEKYATQMMLFDASFELGDISQASMILKKNYAPGDYAYNFRLSKQDHYTGELDKSIEHMLKASELSGSSPYLQTTALSNTADLYIHSGELKKAVELYKQCIRFNSCDFHSMMGLGWIALVHDRNEKLATKIFSFVHGKLKSPDPLFKLSQAAELTDANAAKKYARAFVQQASQPVYGNMYNKYLIQLYTGILNDPASALAIAQREMSNRTTPQTYAWLAWCLYKNGREEDALNVYRNYVSGRPLEALELYWMGKMMKGLGKGYNAQQFFKAAKKNKYDLCVKERRELEGSL
jgi:hypothetical protein